MIAEKQHLPSKSDSSNNLIAFLLVGIASLFCVFLFRWLVVDVDDDNVRISGLGLIATVIMSSVAAAYTFMKQRSEAQIKAKDAQVNEEKDNLFDRDVIQLLTALQDAKQLLSEESICNLLNSLQQEQAQDYISRARKIEKYFEVCQEVSKSLAANQNYDRLQEIAQTACDRVLSTKSPMLLESIHLTDHGENRHPLYEDITTYLRVWLRYSIQYDLCMPDFERQLVYEDLYREIIEHICLEQLEMFPIVGEDRKNIVRKFLRRLLDSYFR
jgi:hypothetical protein